MKKVTNIVTEVIEGSKGIVEPHNSEYKNIMNEIKQMSNDIKSIKEDLDRDRIDIGNTNVALEKLAGEVKELRNEVSAQGMKLKNRMADVMEPAIEQVDKLAEIIKNKKKVVINVRSIFPWLMKRGE